MPEPHAPATCPPADSRAGRWECRRRALGSSLVRANRSGRGSGSAFAPEPPRRDISGRKAPCPGPPRCGPSASPSPPPRAWWTPPADRHSTRSNSWVKGLYTSLTAAKHMIRQSNTQQKECECQGSTGRTSPDSSRALAFCLDAGADLRRISGAPDQMRKRSQCMRRGQRLLNCFSPASLCRIANESEISYRPAGGKLLVVQAS